MEVPYFDLKPVIRVAIFGRGSLALKLKKALKVKISVLTRWFRVKKFVEEGKINLGEKDAIFLDKKVEFQRVVVAEFNTIINMPSKLRAKYVSGFNQ